MSLEQRTANILLVEDNPGDIRLTQEAFKEGQGAVRLEIVRDGVEALRFLQHEPPYEAKPIPDLILLDLNLPKLDGRAVLQQIKSHQEWKRIPVIVLTTSNAAQDVQSCYDLHANCFINKPVDFDHFFDIVQKIQDFWLNISILPTMVR